ncbi:MAG: hypothetical protein C5B49_10540 [Bdellovibrio sp.]|nr:MAG: hypothetical protein C5B49_10540 [Bdellovibrio sp.]
MKCYISLGSNLGDRLQNLRTAARKLPILRVSPLFHVPALLPPDAPPDWNIPFYNAVVEIRWSDSPEDLLAFLQKIEIEMGRLRSKRWAPRLIDLDLILFGDQIIEEPHLLVPHPEMSRRSFVLDPLSHLSPSLLPPMMNQTVLDRARRQPGHQPLWMGILNLTPDSFSDGGELAETSIWQARLSEMEETGVHIFDLGGESTRPGAQAVALTEEWRRIEPVLLALKDRDRLFSPWISVDTRSAATARRALEHGADMINDVSGLADPQMVEVLQESSCQYVLMHSMTIPPQADATLPANENPVSYLMAWALQKLDELTRLGIHLDRILFDPGIGFGKTAAQSIEIIQHIKAFQELPVRLLVGHSRKSFIKSLVDNCSKDRDWESQGISLRLGDAGVDVIRVHRPVIHMKAFEAYHKARPAKTELLGR